MKRTVLTLGASSVPFGQGILGFWVSRIWSREYSPDRHIPLALHIPHSMRSKGLCKQGAQCRNPTGLVLWASTKILVFSQFLFLTFIFLALYVCLGYIFYSLCFRSYFLSSDDLYIYMSSPGLSPKFETVLSSYWTMTFTHSFPNLNLSSFYLPSTMFPRSETWAPCLTSFSFSFLKSR